MGRGRRSQSVEVEVEVAVAVAVAVEQGAPLHRRGEHPAVAIAVTPHSGRHEIALLPLASTISN